MGRLENSRWVGPLAERGEWGKEEVERGWGLRQRGGGASEQSRGGAPTGKNESQCLCPQSWTVASRDAEGGRKLPREADWRLRQGPAR